MDIEKVISYNKLGMLLIDKDASNKAVSRWDGDECAPDLSVVSALAEMFGVTCD